MSNLLLPTPISFRIPSQTTTESRFTTKSQTSACKGQIFWTWSVSDDLTPALRYSFCAAGSENRKGHKTSATANVPFGTDTNTDRRVQGRGKKADTFNGSDSGDEQRRRGQAPPADLWDSHFSRSASTKPTPEPNNEKHRQRRGPPSLRSSSTTSFTKDRRESNLRGSGRRPGWNRFDNSGEPERAATTIEKAAHVRGSAKNEPAGTSTNHSERPTSPPAFPTDEAGPSRVQRGPECPPGMCWRFLNVEVEAAMDPGKDDYSVHTALKAAVASRLGCKVGWGAAAKP